MAQTAITFFQLSEEEKKMLMERYSSEDSTANAFDTETNTTDIKTETSTISKKQLKKQSKKLAKKAAKELNLSKKREKKLRKVILSFLKKDAK